LQVGAMTEVDWAAVRIDYEGRALTLVQIEAKYGVTRHEINKHRRDEGWTPRRDTVATRQEIMARVYRILDKQTRKMEAALDKEASVYGMNDLASVTRTLEKLIALNKSETRRKNNPPESAVMKRLREKLADRIEQLNQG
jgi:hypothetical protein